MPQTVSYSAQGAIGLICIDNPPVNAAGLSVRAGLVDAIARFEASDQQIAVLYGAGRTFIAGADITEFGKPPADPFLPDVIAVIEACEKPVICVIHGTALGGGLEVALGAHYRVAVEGARIGLPEVTLGLLPGAGGTQRLPRLCGLIAAAEMFTSARQVPAGEALELGILDRVLPGTPLEAGLAYAQELLETGAGPRRVSDMPAPVVDAGELAALRARVSIEGMLADAVKRGKLAGAKRDALLAKALTFSTDYAALAQADLVIEAVFEDMAIKKQVFAALDRVCKPGAVLATNTSYLDITEIAAATARPADVLGLHFFSPAHVMKLLEIVLPPQTAPDVAATGFQLAKVLKKVPVRAGVCDGFIGNRILRHYRTAADHMVLAGASPFQIDRALVAFGFAMGPYAVSDLAGLDIGYLTRQRLRPSKPAQEVWGEWPDRLHDLGRLGRKTGRGYYIYDAESPKGRPDPEVDALIATERAARGITPRAFTDDEIVARYMAAMINEAARVVDEGIAQRPLDVDVTLLYGYGFPRWRGGPMHHADSIGLATVLETIRAAAAEDAWFWQPAPLLVRLAAQGARFDSLNG